MIKLKDEQLEFRAAAIVDLNTALQNRNTAIVELEEMVNEANRIRHMLIEENRQAAARVVAAERKARAAYEQFRAQLAVAEREPSCQELLDTPLCGGLADE